jgi:hypothetical protein
MQRKNREITNDLRKLGEEMDALCREIALLVKFSQDIRAICNELGTEVLWKFQGNAVVLLMVFY